MEAAAGVVAAPRHLHQAEEAAAAAAEHLPADRERLRLPELAGPPF